MLPSLQTIFFNTKTLKNETKFKIKFKTRPSCFQPKPEVFLGLNASVQHAEDESK